MTALQTIDEKRETVLMGCLPSPGQGVRAQPGRMGLPAIDQALTAISQPIFRRLFVLIRGFQRPASFAKG